MVLGSNTNFYTGNVSSPDVGGMFSDDNWYDIPPLDQELGSSFDWQPIIGGYEDGTVFLLDLTMQRDFQQMLDTDGKAQSILNLLIYPILAAPYSIEGTKGDKGEVDTIRDILTAAPYEGGMSVPLDVIILQMAEAFVFKRTYFEKVFQLREQDQLVGYKKIAWRPPETCELALDAETGEFRGFRQRRIHYEWQNITTNDFGYVNMPHNRAFVYINNPWKDPISGTSDLQVPFWCYQIKRKLMYLWYQYLETTALPKTVTQAADEKEAVLAARRVATLKSRGVLGLKSDVTYGVLESSGKGATEYIEAIKYLDSQMSQSILAGFIDLSSMASAGKGSFALSEDQSKLFLRTRRVKAYDMARQFSEQIIAPLCHYNFGRKAPCPKLVFGPMSEANEQAVLNAFTNLVDLASASTTGQIAVTDEFFNELFTRVGTILELDPEKIAQSIDVEGSPLERIRNAVEKSFNMVQQQFAQQGETQNSKGKMKQQQGQAKDLVSRTAGMSPVSANPAVDTYG